MTSECIGQPRDTGSTTLSEDDSGWTASLWKPGSAESYKNRNSKFGGQGSGKHIMEASFYLVFAEFSPLLFFQVFTEISSVCN